MFTSNIDIKASGKLLEAYYNALLPEKDFETKRASYELRKSRSGLNIKVKASDPTAFRAVTNSITGLLALVEKTWKLKNK